jgi:hypothetical protein
MIVDSESSEIYDDFSGFVELEKSLKENNINNLLKILNANLSIIDSDTFLHKLILLAENIQNNEISEKNQNIQNTEKNENLIPQSSKKEILNESKIILLILINSCIQINSKDVYKLFKYIFNTGNKNKIPQVQETTIISIIENNLKKVSDFLKLSSVFKTPFFEFLKRSNIKNEICMKLICDYIILIYGLYLNNKLELDREKQLNDLHESILLFSFFPNFEVSDYSNFLMISLIEVNFKHITEKLELNIHGKDLKLNFFEFFSKFLIEEILDFKLNNLCLNYSKDAREIFLYVKENYVENKNLFQCDFNESDFYFLRDLNVLVFVYQYRLSFLTFKEKVFTLASPENNKYKSAIDEIFKSLSYYQQYFYGNFFLNDLLQFVKKNKLNSQSHMSNKSIQIKIENIITCCNSEISYFFCLDTFCFNELFQQGEEKGKNKISQKGGMSMRNKCKSKIQFYEEIKKSIMNHNTISWDKLFRENYILASVYTIGIFSNYKEKLSLTENQIGLSSFNYNSIFNLQQNFSLFENKNKNESDNFREKDSDYTSAENYR